MTVLSCPPTNFREKHQKTTTACKHFVLYHIITIHIYTYYIYTFIRSSCSCTCTYTYFFRFFPPFCQRRPHLYTSPSSCVHVVFFCPPLRTPLYIRSRIHHTHTTSIVIAHYSCFFCADAEKRQPRQQPPQEEEPLALPGV